jgi:adenylyltransferase/sulfurtransferase
LNEDKVTSNQPYFDRQERITWWNQQRLFEAKVLVAGAGALGNELLKNLALLGVGHILVMDFDTIEDSNLSRTVLFRTADVAEGASKALVAATRTQEMNPNPNAVVRAVHGNIVWELGEGIYRHVDLVLGCLDNLEARLALNLGCWRAGKTWIDGGIWELSGSVAVYDASATKACYECGMTPDHYRQATQRYSCTNETVKTNIRQGREPTTQTTSAVVAAIQSQEAVKLLHGLSSFAGRQLIFNGAPHFYFNSEFAPMTMMERTLNPNCLCHEEDRIEQVLELPEARAAQTTARQLLSMVELEMDWHDLNLELGRIFVIEAVCSQCEQRQILNRPLYRVRDVDTVCPTCAVTCPTCGFVSTGQPDCPNCGQQDISEPHLVTFHTLSIGDEISETYLDYTLADLGIPPLHVLTVISSEEQRINVELSGDLDSLWEETSS